MSSIEIYDAISFVATRTGQTEIAAWENNIRSDISLGRLPASITLGRDPQPFKPEWIGKLAQFQAPGSPAPALHPEGPTDAAEWPHEPLEAKVHSVFDRREHRDGIAVTDFPTRPAEGTADTIYFDAPGVVGRDGKLYHRGREFRVDQESLDALYPETKQEASPAINVTPPDSSETAPISKRKQRCQKTKEQYDIWYALALKAGFTDSGAQRTRQQIAKGVVANLRAESPRQKKIPSWNTVLRRLNQDHRGWAEESWAKSVVSKNLPAASN